MKAIAKLAKLAVSPEELDHYSHQLSEILEHFKQLSSVNVSQIEPLFTPFEEVSTLREDQVEEAGDADGIVQGGPDVQGHLFKVPPAI